MNYETTPVGLKQSWKVQAFRDTNFMPSLTGHTTFVETFETPEEAIKCAKSLQGKNKENNSQRYQEIVVERCFTLEDDEQ